MTRSAAAEVSEFEPHQLRVDGHIGRLGILFQSDVGAIRLHDSTLIQVVPT